MSKSTWWPPDSSSPSVTYQTDSRKAVLAWVWTALTGLLSACWSGPESGLEHSWGDSPSVFTKSKSGFVLLLRSWGATEGWFWYLWLRKNRLHALSDKRNPWGYHPMKQLLPPLCTGLSLYMRCGFGCVEASPEWWIHAMVFFGLNHVPFGVEPIPSVGSCPYISLYISHVFLFKQQIIREALCSSAK